MLIDGFAMIRSKGRKILAVLLFCFISTVVCGVPANAVRNDLSLLLSKSNEQIYPTGAQFSGFVKFSTSFFQACTCVNIPRFVSSYPQSLIFRKGQMLSDIEQNMFSAQSVYYLVRFLIHLLPVIYKLFFTGSLASKCFILVLKPLKTQSL